MCKAIAVPPTESLPHVLPHEAAWIHEDQRLMDACLGDLNEMMTNHREFAVARSTSEPKPSVASLEEHELNWFQEDERLMETCLDNDDDQSVCLMHLYQDLKKSSLSKGFASVMLLAATMAKLQAVSMSRDT